ncbi:MAG: hypothetical protein WDW36_003809 [Sanguina aurantia]
MSEAEASLLRLHTGVGGGSKAHRSHHDGGGDRRRRLLESEQTRRDKVADITAGHKRKQDQALQTEQSRHQEHQRVGQLRLKELRASHAVSAAKHQRQVDRLQQEALAEGNRQAFEQAALRTAAEEARRKEEARVKAAADAAAAVAAAAAAERARQLAQKHKAVADVTLQLQQRRQQLDQQQQEVEQRQKALAALGPVAHPCVRVSPAGAVEEAQLEAGLKALEALIAPMLADSSLKPQRRVIEKKLTVHVQQISATVEQVNKKCGDVYQLLSSQPDACWQSYAIITFATKVIRQSDLIQLNNKAAFPLATVLVAVSIHIPQLMEVMRALLHRECPLTVPRSCIKDLSQITANQYHKLIGLQQIDNNGSVQFELVGAYQQRVEGCVLLYAAIVQVDEARNTHGLQHGWTYIARMLNHVPADCASGKALICFLRVAGYQLYRGYKGQFIKLLQCMHDTFLPDLARCSEEGVQAVRTLLEHYLSQSQFQIEPEGRKMPDIDMSTHMRS